MSNWDLMMPGMGLTAIGLSGVTISYAGIAHTFIDGMHALTGLTMFIGLIFLSAGILEGGVSTSNRAKATTLVILGIAFSFGIAALTFNSITTIPTFAGVMLIIAVPAIVMAYVAMKMPQYFKPISIIFVLATGAAVISYVGFGLYGPSQYLVPPPVEEEPVAEIPVPTAPIFAISILPGSSIQGNPDYDPDVAQVPHGNVIEWTNNDNTMHTVTSIVDADYTFDSGMINAGEKYQIDTSVLSPGTYEYYCMVHPWMTASFVLGEGAPAAPEFAISILADSSIQDNPDYSPDFAQVPLGDVIVWTNNDNTIHTATSTADPALFDSDFLNAGDSFRLDTATLGPGTYEYLCLVHPWMQASFEIVESGERLAEGATVTDPNSIIEPEHSGVTEVPVEPTEAPPVEEPTETPTEVPVEESVETPVQEPVETPAEESVEAPAEEQAETVTEEPEAQTETETTVQNTVSIPQGSSSPGCEITNECFLPSTLTVPVGTTVTWTNDDSAAHTVTSGQDATPDGFFDSSLFLAGKTFSYTFDEPGEYEYFCFVHLWMKGEVVVE
jgi:plastocyanin